MKTPVGERVANSPSKKASQLATSFELYLGLCKCGLSHAHRSQDS